MILVVCGVSALITAAMLANAWEIGRLRAIAAQAEVAADIQGEIKDIEVGYLNFELGGDLGSKDKVSALLDDVAGSLEFMQEQYGADPELTRIITTERIRFVLLKAAGDALFLAGKENAAVRKLRMEQFLVAQGGLNASGGELVAALDLRELRELHRSFLGAGILGFVIVCIIVFPAYFSYSSIISPIGHLRAAAEAVGRGDFSVSVPVDKKDEIGTLAQAFNSMGKSLASMTAENALFLTSLKQEKAKIDAVFAQMQDAAVLIDSAGKFLLANNAAGMVFQIDSRNPESIAAAFRDHFQVTPSMEEIVRSSKAVVNFEVTRDRPKKLILAGAATLIQPDAGLAASAEKRWLLVFRDITEARQENILKRTFLSVISHKLNTPLSIFKGYAQFLAEQIQGDGAPLDRKILENMAVQGDRLAKLLNKLTRFVLLQRVDAETTNWKTVDIASIIKEAIDSFQKSGKADDAAITFKLVGEGQILGDARLLQSALVEVIENGAKFGGGANKEVIVSVDTRGDEAILRVRDHGPGIAPEDQERIFSEFYQVEPTFTGQVEGWGLGLPFAKKVTEFHGGKLWIESKLGEGSTVNITFPLVHVGKLV